MTRLSIFCILFLALSLGAAPLPRSSPEAQGASSTALLDFVNALDGIDGMHSVMVVRHGHVIAEGWWAPYAAAHNHVLYSLSKSFTSTAVGLAVSEGKLSIDDEVLKFFPDVAPEKPSSNLKAMRVRDLLTMSTGHQDEPPVAPDLISAKTFFTQAVAHLPGTHFKYNTPATFMQSAIVQKLTGQTVLDYLRPRLFEPLGIKNAVWDTNFEGISLGGYGLRVRTEDIAKFGQLYLQRGRWNGKQLIPAEWIDMAISKQTSNGSNPKSDWNQGYGFQFWRSRYNAYRGDGAFGQYCLVLPDQQAVVAITSGVRDMQGLLNVIWEKLLPVLQSQPLPANVTASQQLTNALDRLEVRTVEGEARNPLAGKVFSRKYLFPTNSQGIDWLTLVPSADGKSLSLNGRIAGKEVSIPCGHRTWMKSRAPLTNGPLSRSPDELTAGSYAWSDDNTCVIKLCAVETPFHTVLKLKFEGDEVILDPETNVAFGPTKRPQIRGRAGKS